MEKWTKVKRHSTKEVLSAPIFYSDYINYMEVAAILIDKLTRMCVKSKALSHVIIEENFDLEALADRLYVLFPEDMLLELMESEFGQGILIGIWLNQDYGDVEGIDE